MDAYFWNAGAGAGCIKKVAGDKTTELGLTFKEPLGFCCDFVDVDGTLYVSLGEGSFDKVITVYVGGDSLQLPAAFFLPNEQTWEVVDDFCKNGERSPKATWAKRSDLEWDRLLPQEGDH